MLKTYELCPKKFYYRYVKNINMPIDDEIFEFGKNIHALASYYLRKENMYKMEISLNEREKSVWKYLKEIEYFSFETISTEYNLSVKINDTFFGGRLDALVKKDNKYYILDYKTAPSRENHTDFLKKFCGDKHANGASVTCKLPSFYHIVLKKQGAVEPPL